MMRILLIEDEQSAARRIIKIIKEIQPDALVVSVVESIRQTLQWWNDNPAPDLIIADIQLADGISFEIFKHISVNVPVVFTTAYDEYTLKAFKLNSIDYLLKPIDVGELKTAFDKFIRLKSIVDNSIQDRVLTAINQLTSKSPIYKTRFLVKRGDKFISISSQYVSYIKADNKIVEIFTSDNQKYLIEDTLEELDKTLDPKSFFRVNRTYVTSINSIEKCEKHFNGRLKITIQNNNDNDIYISREKSQAFKNWLNS